MNKYIYYALASIPAVFFSSCATMNSAAGLGNIKTSESVFDGSQSISMTPSLLYRKEIFGENLQLGATWSASQPKLIGLHVVHSSSSGYGKSYMSIQGLDINIDGKITHHNTTGMTSFDNSGYNAISKTIYTKSHNTILIPLSKLERMIASNDCRLRIRTSQGSHDRIFSKERNGGAPLAKYDLRKFVAKIKLTQ